MSTHHNYNVTIQRGCHRRKVRFFTSKETQHSDYSWPSSTVTFKVGPERCWDATGPWESVRGSNLMIRVILHCRRWGSSLKKLPAEKSRFLFYWLFDYWTESQQLVGLWRVRSDRWWGASILWCFDDVIFLEGIAPRTREKGDWVTFLSAIDSSDSSVFIENGTSSSMPMVVSLFQLLDNMDAFLNQWRLGKVYLREINQTDELVFADFIDQVIDIWQRECLYLGESVDDRGGVDLHARFCSDCWWWL